MNKIQETISALKDSIETNQFFLEQHNWVVVCKNRFLSVRSTDDGIVDVIPAPPFPMLFTAETAIDLVDSLNVYNGRNERIVFQRFTKNEWEQLYLNDLLEIVD